MIRLDRPSVELPPCYDLHTHVLPGIDDGSRSCAQSVQMLDRMKQQGVCFIAATPHFYAQAQSPEEFLSARASAWSRLRAEPICKELEIRLGAEVQYYEGIARLEKPERFCLEGTGLFLLEMPFVPWSERMLSDVRALCENPRLRVMIAHFERYLPIQTGRSIQTLLNMELLIQCNAEFFLLRSTRRKALHMFRQGLIQAVGSDCHNIGTRAPNVGSAMELLAGKFGREAVQAFLRDEQMLLESGGVHL